MRNCVLLSHRTTLASFGAALLIGVIAIAKAAAVETVTATTSSSDPIYDSASKTDTTCVKNNDNSTRINDVKYESPDIEWCRRRPRWRIGSAPHNNHIHTIVREKCSKVLGYEPDLEMLTKDRNLDELSHHLLSSTFDFVDRKPPTPKEDDASFHQLPVMERPLLKALTTCMDDAVLARYNSNTSMNATGTPLPSPRVSELFRRRDGRAVMAVVEDAFSEEEAAALLALSDCQKRFIPEVSEHRSFGGGTGNDCTHVTGFLQLLVPGAAAQIHRTAHLAWETAKWGHIDESYDPTELRNFFNMRKDYLEQQELKLAQFPYSTRRYPDPMLENRIRSSEHLEYEDFRSLNYHTDHGSDYTILVALSRPEDYVNGHFNLCPESDGILGKRRSGLDCPGKISLKPERLSALVFLSSFSHGIDSIDSPGRAVFINELWRYEDVPAPVVERVEENYFFFNHKEDDDDDDDDDDDTDGGGNDDDDFDDDDDDSNDDID